MYRNLWRALTTTACAVGLGILGLDLDDTRRSLLPEIRRATGVLVVGHARGFDSIDTGLPAT